MHPIPNHTAILLFSRSAKNEALHKRYFGKQSKKPGQLLARSLVAHARHLCRQTGFPFFHLDEQEQVGENFGQRLSHAIEQVWKRGYKKVVVIGNDCPGLTKTILQQAANSLEKADWVLGPAANGGVYLIGLTESRFNKTELENIAWQTASVFTELKALADSTSSVVSCLPTLSDVNTATDFVTLAKRYGNLHPWLRSLLAQFEVWIVSGSDTKLYLLTVTVLSGSRRGPPFLTPDILS